jgi:hypothetical protein
MFSEPCPTISQKWPRSLPAIFLSLLLATTLGEIGFSKPKEADPDKAQKEQEKLVTQLERRLGGKADSSFVVLFQRTEAIYIQPRRRLEPVTKFAVEQYTDRHSAATGILDTLQRLQNQAPMGALIPGSPALPPPNVVWKVLGHFDKPEQAAAIAERARLTFKAQGTLIDQ